MMIRAFWDIVPCTAAIIRVMIITLMMEAVRTSKTLVYSETTWRYIPEGSNCQY
jgi:hypothetical protein